MLALNVPEANRLVPRFAVVAVEGYNSYWTRLNVAARENVIVGVSVVVGDVGAVNDGTVASVTTNVCSAVKSDQSVVVEWKRVCHLYVAPATNVGPA